MRQGLLSDVSKVAIGSVCGLAAVYLGLSPRIAQVLYNGMLFHPYRYPEGDYVSGEVGGVKYEDVNFRSLDKTRLHGWFFDQGAEYTVVLSHGNTGNIASRHSLLAGILQSGLNLFAYDYRGYGRSEGKPSIRGMIDDGCAAFDYLLQLGIPSEQIVMYGESLGAGLTCQMSRKRLPAGLILQSGFISLTRIGREHVPLMKIYPSFLFPQPVMNSCEILSIQHPPVLFLHGARDTVVPFNHSEELHTIAAGRKTFVLFPDAAHADIPSVAPVQFVESIRSFVVEIGRGVTEPGIYALAASDGVPG